MKAADEQAFFSRAGLSGQPSAYMNTLQGISVTNGGAYCLTGGHAAGIQAIHYDGVMGEWYDIANRLSAGQNCPTRIDGLYIDGVKFFFVEFKKKPMRQLKREIVKLYRKIYDSVVGLLDHGYKTLQACCKDVIYIVVSTGIPRLGPDDIRVGRRNGMSAAQRTILQSQIFNSIPGCISRPWRFPQVRAHFGLSKLEDVVCLRVLTLTPQQFNLFAKEHNWQ